jgi:hypothetical protein
MAWQQEPVAKDFMNREVYKVPVVGLLGILQIKGENLISGAYGIIVVCKALGG